MTDKFIRRRGIVLTTGRRQVSSPCLKTGVAEPMEANLFPHLPHAGRPRSRGELGQLIGQSDRYGNSRCPGPPRPPALSIEAARRHATSSSGIRPEFTVRQLGATAVKLQAGAATACGEVNGQQLFTLAVPTDEMPFVMFATGSAPDNSEAVSTPQLDARLTAHQREWTIGSLPNGRETPDAPAQTFSIASNY
jgi:hypothetical protein